MHMDHVIGSINGACQVLVLLNIFVYMIHQKVPVLGTNFAVGLEEASEIEMGILGRLYFAVWQ